MIFVVATAFPLLAGRVKGKGRSLPERIHAGRYSSGRVKYRRAAPGKRILGSDLLIGCVENERTAVTEGIDRRGDAMTAVLFAEEIARFVRLATADKGKGGGDWITRIRHPISSIPQGFY